MRYVRGDICRLLVFPRSENSANFIKYIHTEVEVIGPTDNDKLAGKSGYQVHSHDGTFFAATESVLQMLPVSETISMRLPGDWQIIEINCGWCRRSPTKEERIIYGKD